MLRESMKTHPVEPLLREDGRDLFPAADDRERWEGIDPGLREEIRGLNAEYAAPYPMRTATEFLAYVRSDSRLADEDDRIAREAQAAENAKRVLTKISKLPPLTQGMIYSEILGKPKSEIA